MPRFGFRGDGRQPCGAAAPAGAGQGAATVGVHQVAAPNDAADADPVGVRVWDGELAGAVQVDLTGSPAGETQSPLAAVVDLVAVSGGGLARAPSPARSEASVL